MTLNGGKGNEIFLIQLAKRDMILKKKKKKSWNNLILGTFLLERLTNILPSWESTV